MREFCGKRGRGQFGENGGAMKIGREVMYRYSVLVWNVKAIDSTIFITRAPVARLMFGDHVKGDTQRLVNGRMFGTVGKRKKKDLKKFISSF